MNVTIPADLAAKLGLSAPGDEAYLEAVNVLEDGSVEAMLEDEEGEYKDEMAPEVPETVKQTVAQIGASRPPAAA